MKNPFASTFLTIAAGALLLSWPAIVNGYPLVFSDTGGFLEQALMPDIGWDKPWIYGPFLTPFHARISLWPAAFVQCLILSAMLWLTMITLSNARKAHHLALCTILAIGTAAPWFTTLMMPDVFAPITVLGLFTLAFGATRIGPGGIAWATAVTTIAIASHLAHFILALTCILASVILGIAFAVPWRLWRPAVPLATAIVLIAMTNVIGNGMLAISPFGADFALARLVADGPARDLIQHNCPQAAYRLCAWKDRLPTNSDDFLWDPYGPVWADGYGPIRLAPEAAEIVTATILASPIAVIKAAITNTFRQLIMTNVGDAVSPDHLDVTVENRLATYFSQPEVSRFTHSLESQGKLPSMAARFNPLYNTLLILGAAGTVGILFTQWRNNRLATVFAALVLIALLANAFSTGALSGPHNRYQARIAWLLILPPVLSFLLPAQKTGFIPTATAGEPQPSTLTSPLFRRRS